jgi:hypothetical protein
LAPTVGIAATGFLLSGRDPSNFFVDKQIDSTEFIINITYRLHRQDLHRFIVEKISKFCGCRQQQPDPQQVQQPSSTTRLHLAYSYSTARSSSSSTNSVGSSVHTRYRREADFLPTSSKKNLIEIQ